MEQEQLLTVCEVLRVLLRDDITKILTRMLAPVSEFTPLPGVAEQLAAEPKPFLISRKLGYIESIILEKLDASGANIFDVLIPAMETAAYRRNQAFGDDTETPKILGEVVAICKNYLVLSVTSPDFFEGKNAVARFSSLFPNLPPNIPNGEAIRMSLQLMARLRDEELRDELLSSFAGDREFVLKTVLAVKNEMDRLVVFNQAVFEYLELFTHLLGNASYRQVVAHNVTTNPSKTGSQFEGTTFLGFFFQKAVIPRRQDPLMPEFEKTAVDRVKTCKTKGAYSKTCQVRSPEPLRSHPSLPGGTHPTHQNAAQTGAGQSGRPGADLLPVRPPSEPGPWQVRVRSLASSTTKSCRPSRPPTPSVCPSWTCCWSWCSPSSPGTTSSPKSTFPSPKKSTRSSE